MADASGLGIYVLDVGQGDCTFIVPPGGEGHPILLDCNDAYVAERFVANHGITRLRAVVVSHLDRDHVRGVVPFLETFFAGGGVVESLYVHRDRPLPADGDGREIALLLERALDWDRAPPCAGFTLERPERTREPQRIAEGSGWAVDLVLPFYGTRLAALSETGEDPNQCSAVVRVVRGTRSVLISGDATLESWERLEEALVSAVAIRTPHHGGDLGRGERWGRADELYQAVGAEHAFVSVGTRNGYGHPAREQIEAMRRGGQCRVRCTQLTPTCHPDPQELRAAALEIASRVVWPYRHLVRPGDPQRSSPTAETPCAGSMVLWIDADGTVSVDPRPGDDHDRFLFRVHIPRCGAPGPWA